MCAQQSARRKKGSYGFAKSNSISRPGVFRYFTGADRAPMAEALFSAIADGVIIADRSHEYAFEEAAKAHADMKVKRRRVRCC